MNCWNYFFRMITVHNIVIKAVNENSWNYRLKSSFLEINFKWVEIDIHFFVLQIIFEDFLQYIQPNFAEKWRNRHFIQCYFFCDCFKTAKWRVCYNTFDWFVNLLALLKFSIWSILLFLWIEICNIIVEQQWSNSSHASPPNDKIFEISLFIQIIHNCFNIKFFSLAVGCVLSLTFSTSWKIKSQ